MKKSEISSKINFSLFVFLIMLFLSVQSFPQSGRDGASAPKNPAEVSDKNDAAQAEDYALTPYEYINPSALEDFIERLNNFGAKRYRIRDLTQITRVAEKSDKTESEAAFAGVVKLDETKFEYKVLKVEEISDLAAVLNRESRAGFNFRQVVTYSYWYNRNEVNVARKDESRILDTLENLASMPRNRNLILLERETEKQTPPRDYQLVKAYYGIGKKPTAELQQKLDETAAQNYLPIAFFNSSGFVRTSAKKKSLDLPDNYFGIIVEKTAAKSDLQIRFVKASLQRNLKKNLNELARDGFKIAESRLLEALMYKDRETANRPARYEWVKIKSKKLETELSEMSAAGAKLYGTSLEVDFWNSAFIEAQLIFEYPPTAVGEERFEYKAVPMTLDPPKVLSDRTLPDKPLDKFRQTVREGYTFRNLLYDGKMPVAVFERKMKSQINE